MPESSKAGDEVSVANIDTAVAVADKAGLHHPLTIALPADDKGVFSAISYALHDPSREKTVHIDQYGGQVVGTYGFADYPVLAKVVSQGIGLHEGRSFGPFSFWAAALSCLMVIFMCVSGPMMWWRRRPKRAGSIAAPRGRMPLRGTPLLGGGQSSPSACSCRSSASRCWSRCWPISSSCAASPGLQTWFNVV